MFLLFSVKTYTSFFYGLKTFVHVLKSDIHCFHGNGVAFPEGRLGPGT